MDDDTPEDETPRKELVVKIDSPIVCNDFSDTHTPIQTDLEEIEGDTNKKVLRQELENYDIYLHNIHKGFKYATSINALTRLVTAGLNVNKQRRATIEHALQLQQPTKANTIDVEAFDAMGRPIK